MINIDKYLTVRWQMGGRTFPVLDCYGIVRGPPGPRIA